MSLKFGVGHILCIVFVTFVEAKISPLAKADVENSIGDGSANNDKGVINLTMPGTKWFVVDKFHLRTNLYASRMRCTPERMFR